MRYKRAFDLFFSVVGMILLFPFFPIVAILIKLDSKGPIFYKQIRVGRNLRKNKSIFQGKNDRRKIFMPGKLFTMYKFRSMRVDAESGGAQWATKNDTRTTRVGKILRKTHIDELPQLFNIFCGDMSFVGPRPERPIFVGKLRRKIPQYDIRHENLPGITGVAQIFNGYDTSIDSVRNKVYYDTYYIQNCGDILTDVKIILATMKLLPKGYIYAKHLSL